MFNTISRAIKGGVAADMPADRIVEYIFLAISAGITYRLASNLSARLASVLMGYF